MAKRLSPAYYVIIVLLIGTLLTISTAQISQTKSDGFVHIGYPLSYTKTIDTNGLCVGYSDEITEHGSCGKRKFPINRTAAAGNLLFWTLLSTAGVFGINRLNLLRRKN